MHFILNIYKDREGSVAIAFGFDQKTSGAFAVSAEHWLSLSRYLVLLDRIILTQI